MFYALTCHACDGVRGSGTAGSALQLVDVHVCAGMVPNHFSMLKYDVSDMCSGMLATICRVYMLVLGKAWACSKTRTNAETNVDPLPLLTLQKPCGVCVPFMSRECVANYKLL